MSIPYHRCTFPFKPHAAVVTECSLLILKPVAGYNRGVYINQRLTFNEDNSVEVEAWNNGAVRRLLFKDDELTPRRFRFEFDADYDYVTGTGLAHVAEQFQANITLDVEGIHEKDVIQRFREYLISATDYRLRAIKSITPLEFSFMINIWSPLDYYVDDLLPNDIYLDG